MADPVTALVVVASVDATATAAKASMQQEAEQSQLESLRIRAKQNDLAYTQKKLSNLDMIDKVIQRQEAQATTRGVAFSSPSLLAIQQDTLNTGAKKLQNLDIEKSLFNENVETEKQNVKDSFAAEIFGDIADVGMSYAKFATLAK